jgi:adenylate kinase family enzyme
MANIFNELNDAHKEFLKEEIKNELFEILMEKLQDKVKENIQNQLKEYQDNTNKRVEKTQKQLNKLRGLQQTSK